MCSETIVKFPEWFSYLVFLCLVFLNVKFLGESLESWLKAYTAKMKQKHEKQIIEWQKSGHKE